MISSSHPLDQSLCSQQQPSPWAHSPNSSSQPSCAFQGTLIRVQGMYGCSKDCLILIPLKLPQISCFTLSLKCFSSDSDNCPNVGIRPLFQFPHLPRAGPILVTLLFFPLFLCPTEFSVVLYILTTGQVLLSTLSWWSACTSVSKGVFLMYPWREMYSASTLLLCHLVSLTRLSPSFSNSNFNKNEIMNLRFGAQYLVPTSKYMGAKMINQLR